VIGHVDPHQVGPPPNLNEYQLRNIPLTVSRLSLSDSEPSPPGTTPPPAPLQGQGTQGAQQLSPHSDLSVTSKNVKAFTPGYYTLNDQDWDWDLEAEESFVISKPPDVVVVDKNVSSDSADSHADSQEAKQSHQAM
jgi:hypothetical protein